MSVGLFTDKKQRPTEAEIVGALGALRPAWDALIQFIREHYPVEDDFAFLYGKTYGWARRFRIKGKLLTSLYPTQGGFTVQINLDPQAIERAQQMGLGQPVQAAIARANPYPEGRWLFISVGADEELDDIHHLLTLRVETKRLLGKST